MRAHRQQGASLIFALITLVALMIAAVALVRSVDSSSKVLGNIAFQKDATVAADKATQAAIVTLRGPGFDSTAHGADASGYYASTPAGTNIDVTGYQSPSDTARALVDWDRNSCAYATASSYASCTYLPSDAITVNENSARYVIFRICQATGASSGTNCAKPLTGTKVEEGGAIGDGDAETPAPVKGIGQYYRIVVRVVGARESVSFTETIVQF